MLVQVDTIVTDSDGRQEVANLRPEEFEILENGKRQQITHFSYITAAPGLAIARRRHQATDGRYQGGSAGPTSA